MITYLAILWPAVRELVLWDLCNAFLFPLPFSQSPGLWKGGCGQCDWVVNMVAACPLLLVTTQKLCLGFGGHSSGIPTPKERAGLFVYRSCWVCANHLHPQAQGHDLPAWLMAPKAETRMSTNSSFNRKSNSWERMFDNSYASDKVVTHPQKLIPINPFYTHNGTEVSYF